MSQLTGLYVFGSSARGDLDPSSDLDVLAVYKSQPSGHLRRKVHDKLSIRFGGRLTLAEYSISRLNEMFAEGHLFAWHLNQEAKPLTIDGLDFLKSHQFPRPAPYRAGTADAQRFVGLLKSVAFELNENTSSPVHEAGLAYLCLRNIAMSLSVLAVGRPDFTRYAPLNLSISLEIRPPCSRLRYEELVQARHASQRGLPAPLIHSNDLRSTVESSLQWADLIMGKINE